MSTPIADDFPAIAAVINAPEANTPEPDLALADIEPALFDLRANIGILGHLATAEGEVTQDEWQYVENNLISIHRRLEALWSVAMKQRRTERQAHEKALAEAKARTAAPGSAADIEDAEALWDILRGVATVALRQCNEAMARGEEDMSEK
jgi:hypothetical protein